MNQTFPWFEWIVVDDGSPNKSDVEILESIVGRDTRVKLLRQENGGAVKARKKGIAASVADIIVFLDADDLIEYNFIEYLYWALIRNPRASWAYTDQVGFHGKQYIWHRKFSSTIMKTENVACYCAAFRKEIFGKFGDVYPDETRNLWEDWQLYLRLLTQDCIPVHIRQHLFWYRRLDTGELSKINSNNALQDELSKKVKSVAQDVPDGIEAIVYPAKESVDFFQLEKLDFDYERYSEKSDRTRILLLLPHVVKGGADLFNIELAKRIDKERFELSVITTTFGPNDEEWMQLLQEHCSNIFVLKDFLSLRDWPGFIHYYIRSRNIDIVWNISSFLGYYLFPWLRVEFKDVVLANCIHADSPYWRNGGYARLSAAFQEVSELTVVTNKLTLDAITQRYDMKREQCRVAYIGTDTDFFDPTVVEFGMARDLMKIESHRPVVLFLCRISPEKRPMLMLKIAEGISKKLPDVCFLVVGEGEMLERMTLECRNLGLENNVVFMGAQEDVRPCYRDSDVFLLCSLKEGLAQTTFEAMAMELPIVSADVGGQSELVSDTTGKLIPCMQDENSDLYSNEYHPNEIQNYVDALFELLSSTDKCKEIGRNNRELVVHEYSAAKVVREMEAFTNELLTSSDYREARHVAHKNLAQVPLLCKEFVTLFGAYERLEQSANELWEAKLYFQRLVDSYATKEDQALMLRWYAKFLTDTFVGRVCWKVMKGLYSMFHIKR